MERRLSSHERVGGCGIPALCRPGASLINDTMSKIDKSGVVGRAYDAALSRRALFAAVAVLVAGGGAAAAQGARNVELLMFDDPGCPWCRKWRAEVGPGYAASPEGRRAPLRTVMLREGRPAGITLNGAVRASPTFVLVQDGREVGRITGYGGPDFFWSMLTDMMKKLKAGDRGA